MVLILHDFQVLMDHGAPEPCSPVAVGIGLQTIAQGG